MPNSHLLIVLVLVLITTIFGGFETDVSWDFNLNGDLEGWGNATAEEMHMEVRVENGELRGSILGGLLKSNSAANIDSPQLFLDVTRRHFIVMRMTYTGSSTSANFLMRTGSQPSPSANVDHSKAYWVDSIPLSVIGSSPSSSHATSGSMICDNNPYTFYESMQSAGVYIIFDLGDTRFINKFTILPVNSANSPRRCMLQSSDTGGVGPFRTVSSFTLQGNQNNSLPQSNENQIISGFSGNARYWRLLVIDNFGGKNVSIRECSFDGYNEKIAVAPFNIANNGVYKNYYVPMFPVLGGPVLRLRLELAPPPLPAAVLNPLGGGVVYRQAVSIDYIRIMRSPEVWRVTGCLDLFYDNSNLVNGTFNVTTLYNVVNGNLPIQYFSKNTMTKQYATTYDCPLTGGVLLTVHGVNFGAQARVSVAGQSCAVQQYITSTSSGREETLICVLPAAAEGVVGPQMLHVENGVMPGLSQDVPYFAYRVAPPVPAAPVVTNIGAYRVDLIWSPPGSMQENLMTTGYKISWFQPKFRSRVSNMTVGNVTTTSVRGLDAATEYVFAIAAVSEGACEGSANLPTDLYGRRDLVTGGMISTFSAYTNITATLLYDFDFHTFTANQTLNNSGSSPAQSLGPTGSFGSEGSYGLVLVGDANIQNCNVSSTCCDGFDPAIGVASCGTTRSVCAVLPARMLAYDYVIDDITRRQVPSNLPYPNGALPEIAFFTLQELKENKGAEMPTSACGPALRLTPSEARRSGASWYRRQVNVREGFDTYISFQLSNPSQRCDRLDDVNTYCRSRGADGFAFVIQSVSEVALGNAGSGLGYEGIFNALAVELDTYHNFDQMDFYENHISVMTQGWRFNISANHTNSLATTNRLPDLTDGNHTIRIKYDPVFDGNAVPHPSFQVNGFTTWFIENADFPYGGEGDWGTGFGLLYVYIDDMFSPIITTPLNLEATLNLDNGRAFVGLTAATGDNHWQCHDILSWQFRSLFRDIPYTAPLQVNGEGAMNCVNESVCVHQPDYTHYMRTSNTWGKGQDSTEGWQDGTEGFCGTC